MPAFVALVMWMAGLGMVISYAVVPEDDVKRGDFLTLGIIFFVIAAVATYASTRREP